MRSVLSPELPGVGEQELGQTTRNRGRGLTSPLAGAPGSLHKKMGCRMRLVLPLLFCWPPMILGNQAWFLCPLRVVKAIRSLAARLVRYGSVDLVDPQLPPRTRKQDGYAWVRDPDLCVESNFSLGAPEAVYVFPSPFTILLCPGC